MNAYISYYYKRMLQFFACSLVIDENRELAESFLDDDSKSKEQLEAFLLEKKEVLSEKEFFFMAGRACQFVLDEVDMTDDTEGWNCSAGGANLFMQFVTLKN